MTSNDPIAVQFQEIVADVLAVEPEEVVPRAGFFTDLGGESIDLLDLSFRCERHFGTKVKFESALPLDSLQTDDSGRLVPESIARLRNQFPFLDLSGFESDPKLNRLHELLTVGALTEVLRNALPGGRVEDG